MQDFQIIPKKIKNMVADDANIILPAIQRKFVWPEEKICNLFESIMNGYPIGTLLTWEISGEQINAKNAIGFYEFIKNWSEYDNKFNALLKNVPNDKKYLAILDGQQRLQALLIGLRGTYASHKVNKPWKDIKSFPAKTLYLNLKKIYDEDIDKETYCFKFLEKETANEDSKNKWFEVGKIIGLNNFRSISQYVKENYQFENEEEQQEATLIINELNECINNTNILGCYVIDKDRDLDAILDIFIKINSGATPLSKPDLLFSTIIAKWPDAREKFDAFIKNINICDDQSKRFKFDMDFLIRTIMYMNDDIPVTLNIKNFSKIKIDDLIPAWGKIEESIIAARNLILDYGFEDDTIASYNAIMPIVFYIYHDGDITDENIKEEFRKYFIIAQLKNLFGVAGNSTLTETRRCLKGKKQFSMSLFKDIVLAGSRTFKLNNDDEIRHWLETYKKGDKYSFMILSLLDPNFDGSKRVDEDHLYPESVLKKYPEYDSYKDSLLNLNLLQAKENRKLKNDMLLDDYIKQLENKNVDPNSVIKFLPKLDEELKSYSIDEFLTFCQKRENLMVDAIKNIISE